MNIKEAEQKICPFISGNYLKKCITIRCMAWEFYKVAKRDSKGVILYDENHKPVYDNLDAGFCRRIER